jgi:hypothetical protein
MDVCLEKEQIGTLYVRVGGLEGGFRGGVGCQGGPVQKSYVPIQFFFWRLLLAGILFAHCREYVHIAGNPYL